MRVDSRHDPSGSNDPSRFRLDRSEVSKTRLRLVVLVITGLQKNTTPLVRLGHLRRGGFEVG